MLLKIVWYWQFVRPRNSIHQVEYTQPYNYRTQHCMYSLHSGKSFIKDVSFQERSQADKIITIGPVTRLFAVSNVISEILALIGSIRAKELQRHIYSYVLRCRAYPETFVAVVKPCSICNQSNAWSVTLSMVVHLSIFSGLNVMIHHDCFPMTYSNWFFRLNPELISCGFGLVSSLKHNTNHIPIGKITTLHHYYPT